MSLAMPPPLHSIASSSFRSWSCGRPLHELLGHAEAEVRAKPQSPQARWLLFELLCVLGHWERALKQLQTWAGLSKEFDSTAHVMRGLIRAERQRESVFAGKAPPGTVLAADTRASLWMDRLAEALRLAAGGDDAALAASDLVREAALESAPTTVGRSSPQPGFSWITDSDTRLGPVCELIIVGAYRWIAFADLASVMKAAPHGLLDLIWAQVDIELRDGSVLKGYMPMRYPIHESDRDAVRMARETVWSDHGRTGVHARGQKVWMTDVGDMPLLDLLHCKFESTCDEAA